MKRENKAYSFKEQIIELELKEVSTGVHLQEPVRSGKLRPQTLFVLSSVLSCTAHCSLWLACLFQPMLSLGRPHLIPFPSQKSDSLPICP